MAIHDLKVVWTPRHAGSPVTTDLASLPGASLAKKQVAHVFAEMLGTEWLTIKTSETKFYAASRFLAWSEVAGLESLSGLTVARWQDYIRHEFEGYAETSAKSMLHQARIILAASPDVPQAVKDSLANIRIGRPVNDSGMKEAYTTAEFHEIRQAAERHLAKARKRISTYYQRAQRATDESPALDKALRHLLETGEVTPLSREQLEGLPRLPQALLLGNSEALAAAALLVCAEGYNLSVINRLATDEIQLGDHPDEVRVTEIKPRRSPRLERESTVLVGPSSALWRRIQAATEPARVMCQNVGAPTPLLLLSRSTFTTPDAQTRRYGNDVERPAPYVRSGVPSGGSRREDLPWMPNGLPLSFPKLRQTYVTVIQRSPSQHTQETWVRDYLSKSDEAKAKIHQQVARAQIAAIRRAEERLVSLTPVEDAPPEALNGSQDTVTASCKDVHRHPQTGGVCTETFFACLTCENAIITPVHLPRLVLIRDALRDLRTALTPGQWTRWEHEYTLIETLLREKAQLDDDEARMLAARATRTDRENVRLLLKGEFDAAQ
ncbi:hypothetical protein [Nocardioides yefusunii]|uniref:Integrase n=1 Tax=Nocardioides yefusunii TaxID=2500546 RepID=A0ABW1QZ98_9ACTN|nr:hypothetical protein [Nocardioides yefusunii]